MPARPGSVHPRRPTRGTMLLPQITPHEIACTESRCKAMTAFLATLHPAALILEDDAALAPDIPSRQAARAVLDTPLRDRAPIDHILFDLRGSRIARRLKPAQTIPGPVGVRAFESDLEQPRLAMREERHKQRWRRMGEKIYSRSRSQWLRATRQARQKVVEYSDTPRPR